jgi:hypothetical protein
MRVIHRWSIGTFAKHARRTFNVVADYRCIWTERSRRCVVSRAEDHDRFSSDGGSDVSEPHVV